MASNARCFFFLLIALSFSLQTHARDSKLFNKLTKNTKENKEIVSVPNVQAPTLAPTPSPEPEPEPKPKPQVVEHGYGLYGQDPYEYPPTTTNPTKTPHFDEEFSNSKEFKNTYTNGNFNGNGNGNGYVSQKQGMSDTRFLENGKYFYDVSQDNVNKDQIQGNGYGNQENQGMSDTRFFENGKYFYDINNEKEENTHFNTNNNENENGKYLYDVNNEKEENAHFNTNYNEYGNRNNNFQVEKQGMSDTRFLENGKYFYDVNNEKEENAHFNTNNNEYGNGNNNFQAEKQGITDTRFLENGKYYYDVNNEEKKDNEEENFDEFDQVNNNENENNGKFEVEKQGMSDTRFLENGKYFYDTNNEKENNNYNYNSNKNHGDVGFHNNDNIEYATRYNGNGNNEYGTQGREGYNYQHNEYHAKEGRVGVYNYPKKFPKYEFDTMEEYDRSQGYIDAKDQYVP